MRGTSRLPLQSRLLRRDECPAWPVNQMSSKSRQTIRYVRASDGVQLAWAESGSGPPLVKAATWLTHLEHDFESPVWRHWTTFLADHYRYVRYDERGCGMTEWDVRDLSIDRRVSDLETVVDGCRTETSRLRCWACRTARRSALRMRCGTRSAWREWCCAAALPAARCVGSDEEANRMYEAIIELSQPCGEAITRRFARSSRRGSFRRGTDEQLRWFNDLCRKTTSPELAGKLLRARARDRCHLVTPAGAHANAGAPRARGNRRAVGRRPSARHGNSGRPVRRARVAQSRAARARAGMGEVPGRRAGVHRTIRGVAGCGVQRSVAARARNAGAAGGWVEQLRDCRAARHQREDGEKPPVASLRQAGRVVTRAGDCVRARSRLPAVEAPSASTTRLAPARQRRPRRRGRSTAC